MPEEKQMEYIISTLAIEKLKASDEALRMCHEMAKGQINMDDALNHILAYHGINRSTCHGR